MRNPHFAVIVDCGYYVASLPIYLIVL